MKKTHSLRTAELPGMPEALCATASCEPFPFPPAGQWSPEYAKRFDDNFHFRFVTGKAPLTPELTPTARYAWLVRSIKNLPRNGAWQDVSLCTWGAELVQAVFDAEPRYTQRTTMWRYPTGLEGSMLNTLVAMKMFIPASAISAETAQSLLTSLNEDILREAHAAFRQDGEAHMLLWLDDLQRRASEDARWRQDLNVLDSCLTQWMCLERLMEFLAKTGHRGAQARELLSRLAERGGESGGRFDSVKSSKLTDSQWRDQPIRQLAHQVVGLGALGSVEVRHLEESMADICKLTSRTLAEAYAVFATQFCLAVSEEACKSSWALRSSEWLVGPPLRPNGAPVLDSVIELLYRHGAANSKFVSEFRSAFFDLSKPALLAGRIVCTKLNALSMRLQVDKSKELEATDSRPARRSRAGI